MARRAFESPPLPPGRRVMLPGRGTTFVRQLVGPEDAPTVVLLHGWTATADLNWYPSYAPLGRQFSVLALDHRGHGQGIRSWRPFRLEDCADDVAALARDAGIRRVFLVGYSMGGPVALLTWRRHRDLVAGLVLCATSARFSRDEPVERLFYGSLLGLSLAARLTPGAMRRHVTTAVARRRVGHLAVRDWATRQLVSGDAAAVLQAASAIGGFDSRPWLAGIDIPTAVVVGTEDRVVSPRRQRDLAAAIPGARVFEVAGGHGVCVSQPDVFVPVLVQACGWVTGQKSDRGSGQIAVGQGSGRGVGPDRPA